MKKIIYFILYIFKFDRVIDFILLARTQVKLLKYKKSGVNIKFIPQGGYDLTISGEISKFKIHLTSHLKSDTFIECTGGVTIGRYFHVGRGLTILSTNHNYKNGTKIPYDEVIISKSVVIEDFVWCGANVTILPGVTIGEGAVVGAASVISKDVPPLAVVAGNPAKIIGERDPNFFEELKRKNLFY